MSEFIDTQSGAEAPPVSSRKPRASTCDTPGCVIREPHVHVDDVPSGREPTMTLSLARKINTGNYESAEVFVSISGVRAGMTADDLAPLLDTGKIAWDSLRGALREKVNEVAAEIEARLL